MTGNVEPGFGLVDWVGETEATDMLKIAVIGAALALGPGGVFAQVPGPATQVDMSKPALTNTNSLAVKKTATSGSFARVILRSATAKTEPVKQQDLASVNAIRR